MNYLYKNFFELFWIGILFFIFGFITWLNSTLIPFLKIICELTNFQAFWVTFAFYISYFIMALPSGWMLYRIGFKKGISLGLLIMGLGTLVFIPAAYLRNYVFFLCGLFMQGIGLALLQTAVNPYVTILGPIESAAQRISIMGLCNKFAGIVSPLVLGTILLQGISIWLQKIEFSTPEEKAQILNFLSNRIIYPYLIMAISLILLAVVFSLLHLSDVPTESKGEKISLLDIINHPRIIMGFFAIFFYVGAEVIAADTIILHGHAEGISMEKAKILPSLTLSTMMMGYILGIISIPRFISQQKALTISALLGIFLSILIVITHGKLSVSFVVLLGLANAIMWPAIWPLALDGLGKLIKITSAILIMGILGGALLPLGYGWLSDHIGYKMAYLFLLPCYGYIAFYAINYQWRKIKK